eukprot:scaffold3949_cov229-Pinguiococcus_pyrenoidosus.AAC.5
MASYASVAESHCGTSRCLSSTSMVPVHKSRQLAGGVGVLRRGFGLCGAGSARLAGLKSTGAIGRETGNRRHRSRCL